MQGFKTFEILLNIQYLEFTIVPYEKTPSVLIKSRLPENLDVFFKNFKKGSKMTLLGPIKHKKGQRISVGLAQNARLSEP